MQGEYGGDEDDRGTSHKHEKCLNETHYSILHPCLPLGPETLIRSNERMKEGQTH